jgi:hypothetical protein
LPAASVICVIPNFFPIKPLITRLLAPRAIQV